jgi:hypothetical protein
VTLDLTDEETFALLNLLVDTIEADRYPMSPRIRLLRAILAKRGRWAGCRRNSLRGSAAMHRRHERAGQHRKSAILGGRHGKDGDRGASGDKI